MLDILNKVESLLKNSNIKDEGDIETYYNYSLNKLSSFKTDGKCPIFIVIKNEVSLQKILNLFYENEIRFYLIGDGTNILINDKNNDYVILKLGKDFSFIDFSENDLISCGAAFNLGKFVISCCKQGYDFSFLAGVPGTVGGAVYGNSGNKTDSICNYVESIECFILGSNEIIKKRYYFKPTNYSYRCLDIRNLLAITKVYFKKERSNKKLIFGKINENIRVKKASQPLNTFNAGCFFKNPLNSKKTAAELIDELGLKGFCFGGASVSQKHANFIENSNMATPEDIFLLSRIIFGYVKDNYNINLENEVHLIGFK
jgi:UDP-N-acetylmuramate dehydrogenase